MESEARGIVNFVLAIKTNLLRLRGFAGLSGMSRGAWLCVSILLLCSFAFLLSLNRCSGSRITTSATRTAVDVFRSHLSTKAQGASFPAHQFIISGTSAPTATSNLFAAENMTNAGTAGCAAPPNQLVGLIDRPGLSPVRCSRVLSIRRLPIY
jgi:hypothetical protein